jgi:hypothetical protein
MDAPQQAYAGTDEIDVHGFEGNAWGIWNDGGTYAALSTSYKHSGSYALQLRYQGSSAKATTDNMDLSGYTKVNFDYRYAEYGMDGGLDDYIIEYSIDGGTSWTIVKTVAPNGGNGVWYNDSVDIYDNFTSTTKIRIVHSTTSTSEYTYFDDIVISASDGYFVDFHGFE